MCNVQTDRCIAPVIIFSDGKLVVTCETEGAVCHTTVVCDDQLSHETASGEVIELTKQYTVRSYASAEGMENSETVEATFIMSQDGLKGDLNNDGEVDIVDVVTLVDIILNK